MDVTNRPTSETPMPNGLLSAVCKAYAELLRRQRTGSSALVTWRDEAQRGHEFVWIAKAFDQETLMREGRQLRVQRDSAIFDSVQKMHATGDLNPYEREVLYGYPYIVGRLDGRAIRAPLLIIPVNIDIEGSGFTVQSDDEVVRFNTLPFRSEADVAAREQAIERLLDGTLRSRSARMGRRISRRR